MKFKDRIAADKKAVAALPPKEKLLFLWDYYKAPILAAGIVLALLVLTLAIRGDTRDVAMYAVFVNSDMTEQTPDPEPLNDLLEQGGTDLHNRTVDITANLTLGQSLDESYDGQTVQVLAALFGISGLDLFAAEEETFEKYASQDAFLDLSLFLEPELLENPYRYENTDGHTIVGGVYLEDSLLHRLGYYHEGILVGIAARAQNLDEAVAFMKQLLLN